MISALSTAGGALAVVILAPSVGVFRWLTAAWGVAGDAHRISGARRHSAYGVEQARAVGHVGHLSSRRRAVVDGRGPTETLTPDQVAASPTAQRISGTGRAELGD